MQVKLALCQMATSADKVENIAAAKSAIQVATPACLDPAIMMCKIKEVQPLRILSFIQSPQACGTNKAALFPAAIAFQYCGLYIYEIRQLPGRQLLRCTLIGSP